MQVPLLGFVLIWIGLLVAVTEPRALLYLAVFFAPFTQTAVLTAPQVATLGMIPAWMFFVLLALGHRLLERRGVSHEVDRRSLRLSPVVAFGVACIASLVAAFRIDGRYSVPSANPRRFGVLEPVTFSRANLVVCVPLAAAMILVYLIVDRSSQPGGFRRVLRAATTGVSAVAGLGLWEFLHYRIGIPYPQSFFRIEDSARVAPLDAKLGLRRLASVTPEASILAQVLMIAFPVLLVALWRRTPVLSRRLDRLALALIGLVLLLSVSSSAVIGLVAGSIFSFGAVLLGTDCSRLAKIRASLALTACSIVGWVAYLQSPTAQHLFSEYITNKDRSASYILRSGITSQAWTTFHRFPWFGIGVGNSPSYDLVGRLLSSVGVVGTGAFLTLIVSALSRVSRVAWRSKLDDEGTDPSSCFAQGLIVALVVQLLLCWLTGLVFEYAHFWLVIGMILGAGTAQFGDGWGHHGVQKTVPAEDCLKDGVLSHLDRTTG